MSQPRYAILLRPYGSVDDIVLQATRRAAARLNLSLKVLDRAPVDGTATQDSGGEETIAGATLAFADVTNGDPDVMFQIGFRQAKGMNYVPLAVNTRSIPLAFSAFFVPSGDELGLEGLSEHLIMIGESYLRKNPDTGHISNINVSRPRPSVFISYCHSDVEFLNRLLVHLRPIERLTSIETWSDSKIKTGDRWRVEIEDALQRSRASILLISADFLASEFVQEIELPYLLDASVKHGAKVISVVLMPCRFARESTLSAFQSVNDPRRPLATLPRVEQEAIYDKIASEIEALFSRDA
jgi:TIR domain